MQKARSFDLAFLYFGKGYQSKPKLYFLNLFIDLSNRVTPKLTIAPITAKITVFKISSDKIFGAILNIVPDAVPILKESVVSIYSELVSESPKLLSGSSLF